MKSLTTGRAVRLVTALLGFALATSLLAPVAAHAQDDVSQFDALVTEARDTAQATVDAANIASEEGVSTMTPEQQVMGPLAEHLPVIVSELRTYADFLAALEVPADRADDVTTHVAALADLAGVLGEAAASASTGDLEAVGEGYEAMEDILVELAGTITPEYFDVAFISPVRERFESFTALTPEDRTYLEGVEAAQNEFNRRNEEAGRKVFDGTIYVSPADMMRAFYEAGAGKAFPVVEAALLQLSPTERFVDEHEWRLREAADDSRLDRLIGEAARDGDAVSFMAINDQLGLNPELGESGRVYPELDPAFGRAMTGGGPLSASLDTSTPIGRDPYGAALFDILRGYSYADASGSAAGTFSFPGMTTDLQMEAVARNAVMFEAAWADVAYRIDAITPPSGFAADHQVILDYLDAHGTAFRSLLAASVAGDGDAIQPSLESMRTAYCSAAASLSDEIAPATTVYFDATFDICR